MGLFSIIKDAHAAGMEQAHGARLLESTHARFLEMERLEPRLQYIAMSGYLQIREKIQNELAHSPKETRIKIGRLMQSQALESMKYNLAEGYAKLLAGMWLESQELGALNAQQAYSLLEGFAEYCAESTGNCKKI